MHQPWSHVCKNEEIILTKKIETIHYFYHSCVRKKIQICQKYSYFLEQRATHKSFKKFIKKC